GSVLRSVVLNAFYKVFESSGNFIKPPGYREFEIFMWSGGCSGKAVLLGHSGSGTGYAGQPCLYFMQPYGAVADETPVVVGAGGAAVQRTTAQGGGVTEGEIGGNTSF